MIKRIIYRTVAIVLMVAGIKLAFFSPNPKKPGSNLSPEQAYTQKMSELSARYESLELEVQQANEKAASKTTKTPGSANELITALTNIHNKKNRYLADLQALEVPKKFEEAHKTLLEWRSEEQQVEEKLIKGYAAFSEGKKQVASTIESLLESSEKAGKAYEEKLNSIAKKNGFDSIKKFFGQK